VNSNSGYESRSRRLRRVRNRRRAALLSAVALAAIVASAFLIADRAPVPPPAQPAPALVAEAPAPTPVPRRWTGAQIEQLRAALVAALTPALRGARRSSLCAIAQDGQVLYSSHADTAITPASVEKLVVATTALDVLGSEYRYHTLLVASAPPNRSGRVAGDLWLVGSGDPSLRTHDLIAGVRALRGAGVRSARAVAVDATAFRGPEINPLWNPNDANEDYQVAVSAISLDEDTVEFDVRGTTPGAPAAARVNPWSEAVHAAGDVTTVGAGNDPDTIVAALAAPNHFALSGEVPEGQLARTWVPVHGMPRYVGAVFTQLLHEGGIATAAPPSVAKAPASRVVLWDHPSEPLRLLERHMLYVSDNHYADQLLRTLGLVARGAGDDAHGLAVERSDLRRRGIATPGLRLVDGSGLARENRIASVTVAEILTRALSLPAERGFYDLLPQGGRSGTVEGYRFTAALGRVRAKTGHLTGVSSLAGYVVSRRHGIVSFAFMIDGSPGDPDGAMVHAVDRLSEF
jgi:D-alanyl-D-alanine carboxypeptidase/D-alanyl-D-alanine-endopeptidase (penicillin-binding protein 4)